MWPRDAISRIPRCNTVDTLAYNKEPICLGIPLPNFEFEEDSKLVEIESPQKYPIPVCGFNSNFPYIDSNTLHLILSLKIQHTCDKVVILDCRFGYEYQAGHIIGAINITRRQQIEDLFKIYENQNVMFIFHCEFSTIRAPTWASLFREIDRQKNIQNWPKINYKNVFILRGGFKDFYSEFPSLCTGVYRTMDDDGTTDHSLLKQCHKRFKKEAPIKQGPRTPPLRSRSSQSIFPTYRLNSLYFSHSQGK